MRNLYEFPGRDSGLYMEIGNAGWVEPWQFVACVAR